MGFNGLMKPVIIEGLGIALGFDRDEWSRPSAVTTRVTNYYLREQ